MQWSSLSCFAVIAVLSGLLLTASGCGEHARFLYAEQRFRAGDYAEAFESYRQYLQDYPSGAHSSDASTRLVTAQIYLDIESKAKQATLAMDTGDAKNAFTLYKTILISAINTTYPKTDDLRAGLEETRKVLYEKSLALGDDASSKKDWPNALAAYQDAELGVPPDLAQALEAKIKRVTDAIDLEAELEGHPHQQKPSSPHTARHTAPAKNSARLRSVPQIIGPSRLPNHQTLNQPVYQGQLGPSITRTPKPTRTPKSTWGKNPYTN